MANEPSAKPTLISHKLCPYVQRVAIALAEKSLPFIRVDIDLAAKPDWFLAISPLGKTPVLKIGDAAIFESAVILEYLEDMCSPPLHPADPLERADHRAWIEVSSSILNDIAGFYAAATPEIFAARTKALNDKFGYVERRLSKDPYFAGPKFSLVDAAFAPSSAISTSSTRSQILGSWRESRRRQNGGKLCAGAHPSKLEPPPITPRVCARSCSRATPGSHISCEWPLRTAARRSSESRGRADA